MTNLISRLIENNHRLSWIQTVVPMGADYKHQLFGGIAASAVGGNLFGGRSRDLLPQGPPSNRDIPLKSRWQLSTTRYLFFVFPV